MSFLVTSAHSLVSANFFLCKLFAVTNNFDVSKVLALYRWMQKCYIGAGLWNKEFGFFLLSNRLINAYKLLHTLFKIRCLLCNDNFKSFPLQKNSPLELCKLHFLPQKDE